MFGGKFVWLDPVKKETRLGYSWVRTAKIEPELQEGFWKFWRANALKLRDKGYNVFKNKNNDQWYLEQSSLTKFDDVSENSRPDIILESNLKTIPLSIISGLKSWQIPLAEKLVASIKLHNSALDGSATGSGKTFTSIAVARELGMKIGVICPLSVVDNWKRIIKNHFGLNYEFVRNYESLKNGKYEDIVVWKRIKSKNSSYYSNPKFVWTCPEDTLLIFDEVHKCKGRDTKNSKLLRRAKEQGYKTLCLSATSAINPLEMRALGYVLGLHNDKGFNEWLYENGCFKGRFGIEFNNDDYILKKLHKEILLDRGVRITREEIPDFPECDTQAISYTLGKSDELSIKEIYEEMERELNLFEKRRNNSEKSENQLTIQLRARQKIELIKVPLFVELAEEAIENGLNVVIFLNFVDSIKAVASRLKTNCIIWGQNKKDERQKNIDRFQNDECRVCIVSVSAGGAGLSLHDLNGKFPRMALISPSFSVIDLTQVLGRTHRVGGKTKTIQKIVYVANTVEEEICDSIKEKLNNLSLINDGMLTPNIKEIFDKS